MEKDQKILISIIAIILCVAIGITIYIIKNDNKKNVSDSQKMILEYESLNGKKYEGTKEKYIEVKLPKDNIFIYKTEKEIVDILNSKTGIIYFGFADCPYCRSMISILNDEVKNNKIKEIYYLDISNIRDTFEIMDNTAIKIKNGTKSYYNILNVLEENLSDYYLENTEGEIFTGEKRLYAPTIVAVKNGEIVGFHEGTVEEATKNEKLTAEQEKSLRKTIKNVVKDISKNNCTKKGC